MFLRLTFFLLVLSCLANAQQKFHKILGTSAPDFGNAGMQIYDNGFVAVGSTGGGTIGNSDIIIVRTDVDGNLRWQKYLGFTQVDHGYSVVMDSDSGFVIAGYTNSVGQGGYDMLLIKTDTAGNKLWHKTFGGADWEFGYKLIKDVNGGFTLAGQSFTNGESNGDGYLVRTDNAGNLLWEKRYGGAEEDGFFSMRQTSDGGYVMCGHSKSFNSNGVKELYVVRTDNTGEVIWEKTVGDTLEFYARDIEENYDGGFIVVGAGRQTSTQTDDDVLLVRFSQNGVLLKKDLTGWEAGWQDRFGSICRMQNNKFFIVGETSYQFANDVYLTTTDQSGNYLPGAATFGDFSRNGTKDEANFVARINNDRFLVVGTTDGYINGLNKNIFIATFDSLGRSVSSPQIYVDVKESLSESGIRILNNGQHLINVEIPSDLRVDKVVLYNQLGQHVECPLEKNASGYSINMSGLSAGVYVLMLETKDNHYTAKLIKP